MPEDVEERGLQHQLTAGQMAMVAVGGSIGTGLLLGSAAALEIAGPGVILSFFLAAFITLTITLALGELSSMHPAAGSFGVYGDLYLNQWAGFIARAGYWVAISISIGAELVASYRALEAHIRKRAQMAFPATALPAAPSSPSRKPVSTPSEGS